MSDDGRGALPTEAIDPEGLALDQASTLDALQAFTLSLIHI